MNKDALKLAWTISIFVGVLCMLYNWSGNPLIKDGSTVGYCFIGFACTVALGMEPKKFPHYFISTLAGWVWAVIMGWWLGLCTGLIGVLPGMLIGGIIFGIILCYLHIGVFANTVLCFTPLVFVSIATCFDCGGPFLTNPHTVQAMLSVLFGVICACLVMPLNSLWSKKKAE